jgi:hypothetical protein
MFVGSFSPADFYSFMDDTVAAINDFKAAGVKKLLIDLTNNGGQHTIYLSHFQYEKYISPIGGYVCLGQFLFKYLSGSGIGYP